jgi:hypothetical protein
VPTLDKIETSLPDAMLRERETVSRTMLCVSISSYSGSNKDAVYSFRDFTADFMGLFVAETGVSWDVGIIVGAGFEEFLEVGCGEGCEEGWKVGWEVGCGEAVVMTGAPVGVGLEESREVGAEVEEGWEVG